MPTPQKEKVVENLKKRMADSTIAVSTDYSGMSVGETNDLRKALRTNNVEYVIVKNTLAHLAADSGPTGLVFGYGEVVDTVKALISFIKTTASEITIRGALMGDRSLDLNEIQKLALVPSKDELIAKLLGQLNGGIQSLVYVLNSPISGIANVLQRHVEAEPAEEEETAKG